MNCKEERGKKGRENFCLNFSCLAIKMLILTDGRCHHGPSPAVSRGDLKADRTCLVIDWVGTLFSCPILTGKGKTPIYHN